MEEGRAAGRLGQQSRRPLDPSGSRRDGRKGLALGDGSSDALDVEKRGVKNAL